MTHTTAPGQPKSQHYLEGDLIPAPNAQHHDLHSHGGQGLARATRRRGQRTRTLASSWQGDTLALAQPDTPEQEPKCGVRSFYPFLQL